MLYIYSLISIQLLKPKNKKSITMKQNDLQMQKIYIYIYIFAMS